MLPAVLRPLGDKPDYRGKRKAWRKARFKATCSTVRQADYTAMWLAFDSVRAFRIKVENSVLSNRNLQGFDSVAEVSECTNHSQCGRSLRVLAHRWAAFLVTNSIIAVRIGHRRNSNPGMKQADPKERIREAGSAHVADVGAGGRSHTWCTNPVSGSSALFVRCRREGSSPFPGFAEDIWRAASGPATLTRCGQDGRYREDRWS